MQRALTRVLWLGASFLAESAVIAILGGIAGGLLALPINGIVTNTTNWNSFSEVAFAFQVTQGLLVGGLIFSVVMGVVGGFFRPGGPRGCRWCKP